MGEPLASPPQGKARLPKEAGEASCSGDVTLQKAGRREVGSDATGLSARGVPWRPGVDRITPYQPGKPIEEVERELGISNAVKLASNENPLGPSPRVRAALRRAAGDVHRYPDGACFSLRAALSRRLGVKPGEILLGNGSNELLSLLGLAYLREGDEVLTSRQTFVVYEMVALLANAKYVDVPLRDFAYDLDALGRAVTPATRMVFIANPNNPTGTAVDPKALKAFVAGVPDHCLVVLDEAYYEYMDPAYQADTLSWVRERNNLVVLRTFSKAYALAGLRVGYGVAPVSVAQAIERVRDPFNVNSLAQVAAQAALADRAYVKQVVSLARRERKRLAKMLTALGFTVIPSQANFLFVKLPQGDGQTLYQGMLKRGVIVRPMRGPFVRITLGREAENDKMLRALLAETTLGKKV
jgi:histidinol-phosphate aminotransferase